MKENMEKTDLRKGKRLYDFVISFIKLMKWIRNYQTTHDLTATRLGLLTKYGLAVTYEHFSKFQDIRDSMNTRSLTESSLEDLDVYRSFLCEYNESTSKLVGVEDCFVKQLVDKIIDSKMATKEELIKYLQDK